MCCFRYVPPHQRSNPNQGRPMRVSNSVNSMASSPTAAKPPAQAVSDTTTPEVKVNGGKHLTPHGRLVISHVVATQISI